MGPHSCPQGQMTDGLLKPFSTSAVIVVVFDTMLLLVLVGSFRPTHNMSSKRRVTQEGDPREGRTHVPPTTLARSDPDEPPLARPEEEGVPLVEEAQHEEPPLASTEGEGGGEESTSESGLDGELCRFHSLVAQLMGRLANLQVEQKRNTTPQQHTRARHETHTRQARRRAHRKTRRAHTRTSPQKSTHTYIHGEEHTTLIVLQPNDCFLICNGRRRRHHRPPPSPHNTECCHCVDRQGWSCHNPAKTCSTFVNFVMLHPPAPISIAKL